MDYFKNDMGGYDAYYAGVFVGNVKRDHIDSTLPWVAIAGPYGKPVPAGLMGATIKVLGRYATRKRAGMMLRGEFLKHLSSTRK